MWDLIRMWDLDSMWERCFPSRERTKQVTGPKALLLGEGRLRRWENKVNNRWVDVIGVELNVCMN